MLKPSLLLAYFVLLFVLHQDFWWKNDPTLVFGVLPISLAYHVVWTLLVALGWLLVAKFMWPAKLDEEAAASSREAGAGKRPTP